MNDGLTQNSISTTEAQPTLPQATKITLPPYKDRVAISTDEIFRATNKRWNEDRFNSVQNVGKAFSLIREANQQFALENTEPYIKQLSLNYWIQYYFKNGRSLDQLSNLAKQFREALQQKDNINITFYQALCFVTYRVLDQTYQGYRKELLTISILEYSHPEMYFRLTTDEEDRQWGVDILAYEEGKLVHALQLRSESFFYSVDVWKPNAYPNDWVVPAVEQQTNATAIFEKKFGVKVDYISLEAEVGKGLARIITHPKMEEKFQSILNNTAPGKEDKSK